MSLPKRELPSANTPLIRLWWWLGAAGAAVSLGALAADVLPIPDALGLPAPVLIATTVFLIALPLLVSKWRLTLAIFLIWIVVEDLVRKFAGNDLRLYFVKDIIYAVLLVALIASPEHRGTWRNATGRARFTLYAVVAWALAMSIPSGVQDWRLPLLALRLDFLYVPLVMVGYLLARSAARAERWLSRLALLGGAASLVGIVQAVVGPTFLSPLGPIPGLPYLNLVRGFPGAPVYRPTGTFVDPGRFIAMATVAFAIALGALLIRKGWARGPVVVALILAGAAVWVPGGRAALIVAVILLLLAAAAPAFAQRRLMLGRAATIAGGGLAIVGLIALLLPPLFESRLTWYRGTLDPRSPTNEWEYRWGSLTGDTIDGIALGGLTGRGTGSESLGRQYLYGGAERSQAGLYHVEGGYASVAVEWGVVGLFLWVVWSVSWVRRLWQAVLRARGHRLASAGLVLFGWAFLTLFPLFFRGLQTFQDFISNAYFWLISGILFGLPQAAGRGRSTATSHVKDSAH